jgi:ATP-dependent protease HslVU (ClpYQ) peptidase subunit
MTTIAYDRRTKTLAADSQNTDSSGATFKVNKIEHIGNGYMFAGTGHLYTIAQCKLWAQQMFDEHQRPDFEFFLEDPDERSFSCMMIDPTGTRVWVIDDELMPFEPLDDIICLGAGAAYAKGAMYAGASAKQAVEIACQLDTNSFEPVDVYQWPTAEKEKTNDRTSTSKTELYSKSSRRGSSRGGQHIE